MYTNRYARKGFTSPFISTNMGTSPYTTISASENKMRTVFENLLRKSNWEGEDEKSRVLPRVGKVPRIIPSKKVKMVSINLMKTSSCVFYKYIRQMKRFTI